MQKQEGRGGAAASAGGGEGGGGGCSAPRGRSHSQTLSSRLWSPDSCFKSPEMMERSMNKSYSKESRAHPETVWIGTCSTLISYHALWKMCLILHILLKKHAKY